MSEFRPVFQLDKILEMTADMPAENLELSDVTRLLCLDLLTRWPLQRWAWRNDGKRLTDTEWYLAYDLVSQAISELGGE